MMFDEREYKQEAKFYKKKPFVIGGAIVGTIILAAGIIVPMFIEKIPTGNVGLVYSPSGGVQNETLSEGWHPIGLFNKVIEYPTRKQTVTYKDMVLSTRDGKNINVDLSYSYKVDPTKAVTIFKEWGNVPVKNIENGHLEKRMLAAGRAAVSKYDLLGIYGADSTKAQGDIQKIFEEDVKDLGFMVSDVTLSAPKPDTNTQSAIDARIKASQETERKKIELENEKIEADKKRVIAEGEAQKKLVEAKAEAEANQIISNSVTDPLLKKLEAEARIKHGWVTVQGGTPLVEAK
ncbi:prohibitin family protein [Bacillus cereus group sp. TH204-1LC]|uniref:prohibitin family protein n=1 Tax=Bacillus cereus group sp. TH204-1LC TaxID=3018054 RepID=UPI0022DEF308|nr:prohibitin family protein [Bacillus cereus group sp. TH204-1LC]MDA1616426.1 prohibitin family protein [Bacillus cereus group sp. TH204-1LC]